MANKLNSDKPTDIKINNQVLFSVTGLEKDDVNQYFFGDQFLKIIQSLDISEEKSVKDVMHQFISKPTFFVLVNNLAQNLEHFKLENMNIRANQGSKYDQILDAIFKVN